MPVPATYSTGTFPIESEKLVNLDAVLQQLPDNTDQLITPSDVRDAVFTTWENIIFKPTTNSSPVEYIGIDQNWIIEKMLFGPKKRPDGTDVLDNNLLTSGDGDIFFYSSKTSSTSDTKLVFLAGTGSYYWSGEIVAPFIESKVVDNGPFDKSLDFNIVNKSFTTDGVNPTFSGHINIFSEHGTVYINDLRMPTTDQNENIASNGQVLTFRKTAGPTPIHYAEWKDATASTAPATVYFTDLNPVPQTIGGIQAGSTFSSVLIEEMMRKLLYPYISPIINLTINNTVEFNNTSLPNGVTQSYLLTVQNSSTYSSTFNISTGTTITTPSFIINPGITTATYGVISLPSISSITPTETSSYKTASFTVSVSDLSPNTVTYSFVINTVLPFYYGTLNTSSTTDTINTLLSRTYSTYYDNLLTPFLSEPVLTQSSIYNKTVPLSTPGGSGKYIYFGYPSDLPTLVEIRDSNGFEVTNNFKTYSIGGINSPSSRWSGRTYSFYIYVGPGGGSPTTSTIGDISGGWTELYKFNFGTQS
jgi:hypothetical protein